MSWWLGNTKGEGYVTNLDYWHSAAMCYDIIMASEVRETLTLTEVSKTLSKMCLINIIEGIHCKERFQI